MTDLTSYLNDHLAGSVAALELLDRLIETYQNQPLEPFFETLRHEIQVDQETLKELIRKLGSEESTARKAAAWIAEKLSRGKIQLSDSNDGELGLFLALEALVLGIAGKQALWAALASSELPGLSGLDFAQLERRAADQRQRVEGKRLEVARGVFGQKAQKDDAA